jgi:hypothetical protein
MAKMNNELKGFSPHIVLRVIGGIIIVSLLTYGAHWCFGLYHKYMMVETAENINSKKRDEIDRKFPNIVLPNAVKSGFLGPKDGVERYLGGDPKKVAINKTFHGKLVITKALVEPISYELEETLFGWRTNDLINSYLSFIAADNDLNFQLGILNATRIYTKILNEKLSRSKDNPKYNQELKNAYDAFMVDETRYIGPSAEYKYNKGIGSIKAYGERVAKGEANFYITPENLAVLINSSIYLINECEGLLKNSGKANESISTFQADNHFYYSKGVIKVVLAVLKGMEIDFNDAIVLTGSGGELKKAYETLDIALTMDPFIVTEGSLDGFFANHRSNLGNQLTYAKDSLNKLNKNVEKRLIFADEKKEILDSHKKPDEKEKVDQTKENL